MTPPRSRRVAFFAASLVTISSLLFISPAMARQTIDQRVAWDEFRSENDPSSRASIRFDEASGSIARAAGFLWPAATTNGDTIEGAREFMRSNKSWLGVDVALLDLRVVRNRRHRDNTYVRFQQYWDGIEILDARLHVSLSIQGVFAISGSVYNDKYVAGIFSVSEQAAEEKAKNSLGDGRELGGALITKKLLAHKQDLYLEPVYDVRLGDITTRLSAESGNVIFQFSSHMGSANAVPLKEVSKRVHDKSARAPVTCATSVAGKAYNSNPTNPDTDTTGDSVTLYRLCSDEELDGKYITLYQYDDTEIVPHDGNNKFEYDPEPKPAETSCSIEGSNDYDFNNHDCSYFDAVNVYFHIDEFAYYMDATVGVQGLDTTYKIDAYTHDSGRQATFGAWSYVGDSESDPRFEFAHREPDSLGGRAYDAAKFEDIIYHEYSHLLAWATTDLGYDTDTKQRLNEGYADFFTAAYTDDAEIAEKWVRCEIAALAELPENDGPDVVHIREVNSSSTTWNASDFNSTDLRFNECEYQFVKSKNPTVIEVKSFWFGAKEDNQYAGGMIWAGALWDIRNKGTRTDAIQLVIDSMEGAPGAPSSFEDAAQWILEAKAANPSTYASITYHEILESFFQREIYPEIDEDWTIPSGVTLTLDGATLKFGTGVQLTVAGTLTATGVTFQAQGAGTWEGISVTGTTTLTSSDVEDVSAPSSAGAIDCSSCTLDLDNTNVSVASGISNNYAIKTTGTVTVDSGVFDASDHVVVLATGSSASFSSSDAEFSTGNSSNYSINASSSADVDLIPGGTGSNTIKGLGLVAQGGGTIDAGSDSAQDGEQHFCRETGTVTLRALGSGTELYAEYSYFPSGDDPVETATGGATIFYDGNQGSATCSYSKGNSQMPSVARSGTNPSLPQLLRQKVRDKSFSSFVDALGGAEVSSDSRISSAIMSEIRNAYKKNSDPTFRSSLKQLASKFTTTSYPKELFIAQAALIDGQKDLAANLLVQVAALNHGTELANRALVDLVILSVSQSDYVEARYFFDQLSGSDESVQETRDVLSAIFQRAGVSAGAGKDGVSEIVQAYEDQKYVSTDLFEGLSAYPNPFNPETIIQFNLRSSGRVQVQIVDVLGRIVETLADGPLASGQHQFRFNARLQTSGLYFVRVGIGGRYNTLPIVFLK